MTRYAAFLRGVNVGGVNLKMAEVAAALEKAGFTNVKTILASGNVLLESRSGVDAVRKKAEKALRDEFGYDAWVLAYDLDTVRAISDAYPFDREVEGHHSYVTFVTDDDVLDELAALAKDAGPDEKIKRGKGVIYWQVPNKGTLDTTIGKTMGKKRYKSSTTTRNLRTLDKVLRMSERSKTAPDLTGVSETALLTLLVRATEARRPDSVIDDPMAIKLVDAIDFDFAKFGFTRRQDMALRALTFDNYTRRYLVDHPSATVVALAEGLQTSFYRLDASGVGHQFRWLTVDLPPIIELRERLLPHSDRVTMCAQSALGLQLDGPGGPGRGSLHHHRGSADVPAARGGPRPDRRMRQAVSGRADDVRSAAGVLRRVGFAAARACRCATGCRRCRSPCRRRDIANLANTVPGVRAVHDLPMAQGRGKLLNTLMWTAQRVPLLDPVRPVVTLLEFG